MRNACMQPNPSARQFNNFVDQFFAKSFNDGIGFDSLNTVPSTNIIEQEHEFVLSIAVPGIDKEAVKITVENNTLKVSYSKEETEEEKQTKFRRREFKFNAFSKSFTLPEIVDVTKVVATYNDGILNIALPKNLEAIQNKVKTIEII